MAAAAPNEAAAAATAAIKASAAAAGAAVIASLQFLAAARAGDTAKMTRLLDDDAANMDCNDGSEAQHSALELAAAHGRLAAVRLLLERKAKLRAHDPAHSLVLAARNGHADVAVALLTEAKLDPNQPSRAGTATTKKAMTAFNAALKRKRPDVVLALLKAKARVANNDEQSPLFSAVRTPAYRGVVVALLAAKACPNAIDAKGRKPLYYAARADVPATCVSLLDAKAQFHRDANGDTELHVAASACLTNVVCALLQGDGGAAVHQTRKLSDRFGKFNVKVLNLWSHEQSSALSTAAEMGKYRMCAALLDAKALVESPKRGVDLVYKKEEKTEHEFGTQQTPLCRAARHGNTAVCALLLSRNANVNHLSCYGSPLVLAACDGQAQTCALLLKHKANPEQRDEYGDTAIICAAYSVHEDVCKRLLEGNASVHATDAKGCTALQRCRNSSFRGAPMQLGTARVLLHAMNRAAHAFTAQARCARAQHVEAHWTDSPLFDWHLVREITQYIEFA
jgi:ankyrin repeat protein